MTASRKNLLYVHTSSHISGAEVSLELLIKTLDCQKYHPIVLLPLRRGPYYKKLKQNGILLKRIPMIRYKNTRNIITLTFYFCNWIVCLCCIIYYGIRYQASLIHGNTTKAHIYAIIPAIILRIPGIWHVRDTIKYNSIIKILHSWSTKIICVSTSVIPDALKRSAKITVIANGIYTGEEMVENGTAFRDKYGINTGTLLIAQIGQLIPWKNHADFIHVAALVIKNYKDIQFVIVGEDLFKEYGSYKKDLQDLIRQQQLEAHIIFTGFENNMWSVLTEIDILVHTAENEPFGRSIIEAMASKKPVIAYKSGGPAEIIADRVSGFLVQPGNVPEMAEKVLRLIDNKNERAAFGIAGYRLVKEYYDIKKQTRSIENIYQNLLPE